MVFLTTHKGFTVQPVKGGFGIFHNGQRCLDYFKVTGLAKTFKSPNAAVKALDTAADFDVYEGIV